MNKEIQNNLGRIEMIDSSFREGMQSPLYDDVGKYFLTENERAEIALGLMKYGVRYLEVFSPIVNGKERESLDRLVELRNENFFQTGDYVYLLAHVRCNPFDVEKAVSAGVDGLNMYMGTSDEIRIAGHGKSLDEVAVMARGLLEEIQNNYPHLLRRFSGEDAFRTKVEDLFRVYDPIADLVHRFGVPDTVGVATPRKVFERVSTLKERYPFVDLEGHFHNDRGFSIANSISAVEAGMKYIQTSVLGLGERSGISSLTGLIFNLSIEDESLVEGYNLEQSYALNVLMAQVLGIQVPTTESVNLTHRTHSAGPHAFAVMNNERSYEAHDLERFGVCDSRLLLGPLSGKHVVKYYLNHVLNFVDIVDGEVVSIFEQFKSRSGELTNEYSPTMLLEDIATNRGLLRHYRPVSHKENI